jgi:AraC-like DNA-binding protein
VGHHLRDRPDGVGREVDFSDHPGVCGPMARWGGTGAITRLVCGEIHVDEVGVHPLRELLPRVMLHRAATARGAEWLDRTLALIALEAEASRPGARTVIVRLVDVLFVQAIRAWLASDDAAPTGWLRGLGDPQVAAALARMHRAPGEEFTLEALASSVGMSRSSFCERFSRLVGESPLEHLTRWRMHCSAMWLRSEPQRSVGEIAGRVGYQSEAAFCRAFKRVVGISPGRYRRAPDESGRAALPG